MMIYVWLMAGASAGPLWIGLCDSGGDCDIVPDGRFYRFRSRSEELTRTLTEGRCLLEAEGHRPVRGCFFLDAEGARGPFHGVNDRGGQTERAATEVPMMRFPRRSCQIVLILSGC